ncbi:hypothetical protein D9M69_477440 [compost metagenome]
MQQLQQGFGGTGATQGLAQVSLAEGAGEQLQQAQMFIGFGGDADRQVNDMTIAPVHAIGELHQAHTGGEHQVAGFGRTVGDGNTLTEKGRALSLPRLQAGEITLGNQAVGDQMPGQQLQGCGLIHSRLAHRNLLYSELEHAFSFLAPWGTRYCFE